ncbi:MAG TPA: ATP-binding protein, partial [Candidatus Nanoarchaeia archaeon]|nr:ATP-binding protein [Candidatus Nanoarchaeia archaeon]
MNISDMRKQNPWWEDPGRIHEDLKLREFENASVKWMPRLLKYINLEKNAVYSLRGPRQVGKTTVVKILIRNLLAEKNASNIMYFACDSVKDNQELIGLLEEYNGWVKKQNSGRIFIFLDEITAVKDWQKAIKFFIDSNSSVTMLITGSNVLDIKKSTERLPGRTGEKEGVSSNKILLPMKFAEYVEMRNPQLYEQVKKWGIHEPQARNEEFKQIISGNLPKSSWDLSRLLLQLDSLFDEYLITGGIMLAVNEYANTKKISPQLYDLYLKQVIGDITRSGREEKTAKLILASILKRMGTAASWNGIRTENDIASSSTVEQYAYILRDTFVISIFYLIELDGKQKPSSNKKIYVENPFIFHALRNWLYEGTRDPFITTNEYLENPQTKSVLVESVVANHLCRIAYSFRPSDIFDPSDNVFYTKTKKGIEIDFILRTPNGPRGVEVKYQNQINIGDLIGIKKLKQGVLVSKSKFEQKDGIAVIPVSLFLLYI